MQFLPAKPTRTTPPPSAVADLCLLSGYLVGAFAAIWLPDRWEPRCFFGLVLVAMSISAWRHRGDGFWNAKTGTESTTRNRPSGWFAWAIPISFTLVAVAILYVICLSTGAFHGKGLDQLFDKSTGSWLQTKLPTIVGQQIMLQLLLLPVLVRLFKRGSVAIFSAALIFSLLHLPNPILVLLTFIAGVVWVASFYQARRLTPVVVSHCVLAMMAAGLCGEYIFNLRVGPKCAELFPRQLDSDTGLMYEYPGCTVGIAERLIQRGDVLTVEGWAYDSIHQRAPESLFLNVDGKLKKIDQVSFRRVSANQWKNAAQSGFVSDTCYSFTATIPLDATRSGATRLNGDRHIGVEAPVDISLFAANVNGNLTRLSSMGDILPILDLQTEQAVVLFPVEVDGRINALRNWEGDVQLSGWTADLQSHAIPKRMYVEVDGDPYEIDIQAHRSPRPDIARALKDPSLAKCGFNVPMGDVEISSASQIRCFAVDEQEQLHPIHWTKQAKERVAEQASPNFK